MLDLPHHDALTDLGRLEIHAASAEVVTWHGRKVLRLVDGLALLKEEAPGDLAMAVEVAAEEPCYPGIAFHAEGPANHELAYAQPHTSGQWDALQYDPVFRGSATWQIHHGPAYQKPATVPLGEWFSLRVRTASGRAEIDVDRQPPLAVARLAHGRRGGRIGVWTYRAAYFRGFAAAPIEQGSLSAEALAPVRPPDTLRRWYLDGVGPVEVEENGTLNLNRFLDWQPGVEASLSAALATGHPTHIELRLGYSDELELSLDGLVIHSGRRVFRPSPDHADRGYVIPGSVVLQRVHLLGGRHVLTARLRTVEPFGWGLTVAASGEGLLKEI